MLTTDEIQIVATKVHKTSNVMSKKLSQAMQDKYKSIENRINEIERNIKTGEVSPGVGKARILFQQQKLNKLKDFSKGDPIAISHTLSFDSIHNDIITLNELYDISYKLRDEALVLTTQDIILNHEDNNFNFGSYNIRISFLDDYFTFYVYKENIYEDYVHPHVNSGDLCLGAGQGAFWTALKQGRFIDAIDVYLAVMNTYYGPDCHKNIENWLNYQCKMCQTYVYQSLSCRVCNKFNCRSSKCAQQCRRCRKYACTTCNVTCNSCDTSYCKLCTTKCGQCHKPTCAGCITMDMQTVEPICFKCKG